MSYPLFSIILPKKKYAKYDMLGVVRRPHGNKMMKSFHAFPNENLFMLYAPSKSAMRLILLVLFGSVQKTECRCKFHCCKIVFLYLSQSCPFRCTALCTISLLFSFLLLLLLTHSFHSNALQIYVLFLCLALSLDLIFSSSGVFFASSSSTVHR